MHKGEMFPEENDRILQIIFVVFEKLRKMFIEFLSVNLLNVFFRLIEL